MASTRSRFDFSPATHDSSYSNNYDDGYGSDGLGPSWLTTAYPRALCSMGDVDCWDLLLTSSQPCNIFHLGHSANNSSTSLRSSKSRRHHDMDTNSRTDATIAVQQEQAVASDHDLGYSKARRQDRDWIGGSVRDAVLSREPLEQTSFTKAESFPRSTQSDSPTKTTQTTWRSREHQVELPDTIQDDTDGYYRDGNDDEVDEVTRDLAELEAVSPGAGLISQALCNIGFDCIDYFTMTRNDDNDNDKAKSLLQSSRRSRSTSNVVGDPNPAQEIRRPRSTRVVSEGNRCDTFERLQEADSPVLKTLSASRSMPMATSMSELNLDLDVSSGWAAAVCGKRMAALERKRVLSRSSSSYASSHSMAEGEDASNVDESNLADPWFETWDRLSRWEEVAYR